jgi:hypothetical protein
MDENNHGRVQRLCDKCGKNKDDVMPLLGEALICRECDRNLQLLLILDFMDCKYKNDEEGEVVGAKCYECEGYLRCWRYEKIRQEGKAWWI